MYVCLVLYVAFYVCPFRDTSHTPGSRWRNIEDPDLGIDFYSHWSSWLTTFPNNLILRIRFPCCWNYNLAFFFNLRLSRWLFDTLTMAPFPRTSFWPRRESWVSTLSNLLSRSSTFHSMSNSEKLNSHTWYLNTSREKCRSNIQVRSSLLSHCYCTAEAHLIIKCYYSFNSETAIKLFCWTQYW
jgi:hypothetical protein